ncbi:Shiga toxin A subunit [Gibbsiella quercinecans]|uniref:Shiga toxin A subunit n=1 Tax=Gibbsiella quercinecans TaxID=929813 RepID=UPI003A4D7A41
MIRPYVLTLAILPFASHAADVPSSECAARGHYAEEMLLSAVTKDGVKGIERSKTTVEVLNLSPVSDVLARQFAQADAKTGNGLSVKEYYGIYHDNGAMNLTAKYTYTNVKGASNVYIVSSLLNNDECSVRFNGYLTLSREF